MTLNMRQTRTEHLQTSQCSPRQPARAVVLVLAMGIGAEAQWHVVAHRP